MATNFIGDQSTYLSIKDMEYESHTSCGHTNTEFSADKITYSVYYPSITNVAYNSGDIDASVQIGSSSRRGGGTERVDLENLHISTQAVGVNSVTNVANTYTTH